MASQTQTMTATAAVSPWDEDPVLTVEHLTMRFGGLVAINDLSFNVGRGDITALIGPNGAGKTTVFNCVTGFYKPTEGRIVMRHGLGQQADSVDTVTRSGRPWMEKNGGAVFLLERMPDFEISARAKVARTFQNIRLFGGMTVLENLFVAQHNKLMGASNWTVGGILGLSGYRSAEREARDRAVYWLEQVNLIDRADDPAADLPYGAQRRLEIARAMCAGPRLLCLDEPAAGLNPRETAELNELLQFIRKEHDTSVLLIEHDMGMVMEISDHIVVLDYGEKISDGNAEDVRSDPKVIAAYLGVEDEEEIADLAVAAPPKPTKKAGAKSAERSATAKPAAAKPTAAKGKATAKAAALKPAAGAAPKKAGASAKAAAAASDGRPEGLNAPRGGVANNLTRIRGIGPASEKKLNALGIFHFDQIAAWKKREVEWVGDHLAFPGRIEREEWVKQAKVLAKGKETEFSKRVDAGDVKTSRPGKARAAKGGKA